MTTASPAEPLIGPALIDALVHPKAKAPTPRAQEGEDDEEKKEYMRLKAIYEPEDEEEDEPAAQPAARAAQPTAPARAAMTWPRARELVTGLPKAEADALVAQAVEHNIDEVRLLSLLGEARQSVHERELRRRELDAAHGTRQTTVGAGGAAAAPHASWDAAKAHALAEGKPLAEAISFANGFKDLRERKFGTEEQRRGVPVEA